MPENVGNTTMSRQICLSINGSVRGDKMEQETRSDVALPSAMSSGRMELRVEDRMVTEAEPKTEGRREWNLAAVNWNRRRPIWATISLCLRAIYTCILA